MRSSRKAVPLFMPRSSAAASVVLVVEGLVRTMAVEKLVDQKFPVVETATADGAKVLLEAPAMIFVEG